MGNAALRAQLQLVQKQMRVHLARAKVSTISEDDSPKMPSLFSRLHNRSRDSLGCFAAPHGLAASNMQHMTKVSDPLDVTWGGPPPTLNLGDRFISSPW